MYRNDDRAIDLDQGNILSRIFHYLTLNKRDFWLLEKLKGGYCAGITSLWLYGKWLQTQPVDDPAQERDDNVWFKKVIELIARWDGKSKFSPKEVLDIERFISLIEYFQHPYEYLLASQGGLDDSLLDNKDRVPSKEYSIAGLFNLDQLKELLASGIIRDNKLISIGSHNHATAIFKQGDRYCYFDPNNPVGEVEYADLNELAEEIFIANDFIDDEPSPIGLQVFALDDVMEDYPDQRELLKLVGSVDGVSRSAYGFSPLHIAATIGCLDSIDYFLDQEGVALSIKDARGITPLVLAARNGYIDVMHKLLDADLDLEGREEEIQAALISAVKQGYIEIIEDLIDNYGADPNFEDRRGNVPLMEAVYADRFDVIRVLLENGADSDQENIDGETALGLAIELNSIELVLSMIDFIEDPAEKERKINEAFIKAAKRGRAKMVNSFLAIGADANFQDEDGNTALIYAVEKSVLRMINTLIAHKANVSLENRDGDTAFSIADQKCNEELKQKIIEELESGEDFARGVAAGL